MTSNTWDVAHTLMSAKELMTMSFPERLVAVRKDRGFTQQSLAGAVGLSKLQIHRYEAGSSQPTLHALRNLARVLHVSVDSLVFGEDERGPSDELKLQFEAVESMCEEDQKVISALIDAYIKKQQIEGVLSR